MTATDPTPADVLEVFRFKGVRDHIAYRITDHRWVTVADGTPLTYTAALRAARTLIEREVYRADSIMTAWFAAGTPTGRKALKLAELQPAWRIGEHANIAARNFVARLEPTGFTPRPALYAAFLKATPGARRTTLYAELTAWHGDHVTRQGVRGWRVSIPYDVKLTAALFTLKEDSSTDEHRFWGHVDRTPDCWVWTGSRSPAGYGRFHFDGRNHLAHRISWFLATGTPVSAANVLRHLCDTPACVRPDHLKPGTPKENTLDRSAVRTHGSRLYGHDVAAIRADHAAGMSLRKLAAKHALSKSQIHRIIKGLCWARRLT